jgi:predicted phage tail protein
VSVVLKGAKGGGSSPTAPTEAPDGAYSIALARVVDLLSEGEIRGPKHGFDLIAKDVYYNETPVQNEDGSFNFAGVTIDSRAGTQTQQYMTGFPGVESETGVGLELTDQIPWVQQLTNTDLSAVRVRLSVPSLQKSDPATGNVTGYSIAYAIDIATDGGAFVNMLSGAISDKHSGKYERAERINLPHATTGWTVRVRRITPNQHKATISDTMTLESYTEIIDVKLRYPNSAVIGQILNAQQFTAIPSRSFDMYGRIIQVPANYDPITRVYATTGPGTTNGAWDGSFKPGWSDNPAWIYYDLILHPRYGLGDRVKSAKVDKWNLYRIAQYCDQLVSDGKGGLEPRFTCTLYLQKADDAQKVLNDLASVFRGMPYWAGGAIQTGCDMPADADYTYSRANIVGDFSYAGSSRTTRFTVALVSWNDPDDFGRAKVEYVPDRDGIRRYGIVLSQTIAVGATSRGQAQRWGLWALYTSRLDTDVATFVVGLDGTIVAPGRICRIADPTRAGKRTSGRISASTRGTVTVDAAPAVFVGDTITAAMPSGVSETRTVSGVNGRVVSVGVQFSDVPLVEGMWVVENDDLSAATYRVLGVAETQSGKDLGFTITAVIHNYSKFAAVDSGALITIPTISFPPKGAQLPATNVRLSSHVVINQGIAYTAMTIAWDRPAGAVEYSVDWRVDDGTWIPMGVVGKLSVEVQGVYSGLYVARVAAMDANGNMAPYAYSAATEITGKLNGPPPPILTATPDYLQIDLAWTFPQGINISDSDHTDIALSRSNDVNTADIIGTYPYPLNNCIVTNIGPGEQVYLWGRLVDKSGNIGNWSDVCITTGLTSDQFFQPVLDAADAAQADVDALRAEVDADVVQLHADIDAALKDAFPAWAGGDDMAGNNEVLVGRWTAFDAQQEGDQVFATNFALIGARSADGKAFIFDSDKVLVSPDETLAQRLASIEATAVDGAQAAIDDEAQARADADSATAQVIQSLSATVDGVSGSVTSESKARADADGALSTRIDSINATGGDGANARIDAEITARVNGDSALGQSITALTASVNNNTAKITTEQTTRAAGDAANASSIQTVSTTVAGHTTSITQLTSSVNGLGAKWAVVLDANGRISGLQLASGAGGISAFNVVADNFNVTSPSAGDSLTWSGGVQIARSGGYMKVMGKGFGVGNVFVEWYGPVMAVTACSKSNGLFWLDKLGNAYFGGTLSAGALKNSVQSSQVSNTASVDTGPFGTNGGPKSVISSISYSNTGYVSGNQAAFYNALVLRVTVTTQRSYNGGAFATIGSFVATGNVDAEYDPEFGRTSLVATLSGAATLTDNLAGLANFDYKATLSAASGWPITTTLGTGGQRLAVVSTE